MNVRQINAGYRDHFEIAFWANYDLARKLASSKAVEHDMCEGIMTDPALYGNLVAFSTNNPLSFDSITRPKKILNNNILNIRQAINMAKLEQEMQLLDPSELKELIRQNIFAKHGDKILPVAGRDVHEPRSKWPYLRLFRHIHPSDIQDSLRERRTGIDLGQRALKTLEVLDTAAQIVDATSYMQDASMEDIFR